MKLIDIFKYVVGIFIACLGYITASTLTDIKMLLEANTIKTEQLKQVDYRLQILEKKESMIFDKAKWHYEKGHYIYS